MKKIKRVPFSMIEFDRDIQRLTNDTTGFPLSRE